MELRDLTSLVRLADSGSLNAAAIELGVDVSTLSRRLARVEDELGILIFERGRAGLTLTQGGRDLLRLARRVIDDMDALRAGATDAGQAQTGRLALAVQLSSLGPRIRSALEAFRALHPRVRFELVEAADREIVAGLRDRRIDAAIMFNQALPQEVGALELWSEPLVLAVPSEHPLALSTRVHWEDVRRQRVLVRGWTESQSYREIEAALIGSGADFRTHRAGCVEILNLIAIGEGVMIVLESHRELSIPGVSFLDIDEPNARVRVSLAWWPDIEDPVAGSFVAFMRDHVSRTKSAAPSQTPDPSP
jgi:DNA-binding transcriptional LysR family regulator